jgi:GTPase SAR1 family protein
MLPYKITVVGHTYSGKTSLIRRLCGMTPLPTYKPTVMVDITRSYVTVDDRRIIIDYYEIPDIVIDNLTHMLGSDMFLVVVDQSNSQPINRYLYYISQITYNAHVVVCGNKKDISYRPGLYTIDISTVTGYGCRELLRYIVQHI